MKKFIVILFVCLFIAGCGPDYKEIAVQQNVVIDKQSYEIQRLHYQLNETLDKLNIITDLYKVEINKPPLKYFEDLDTLKQFLEEDTIDSRLFSDDYICVDFSEDLIENAAKKGYLVYPYVIVDRAHMICMAFVYRDEFIDVYLIEPQEGTISLGGWFARSKAN